MPGLAHDAKAVKPFPQVPMPLQLVRAVTHCLTVRPRTATAGGTTLLTRPLHEHGVFIPGLNETQAR